MKHWLKILYYDNNEDGDALYDQAAAAYLWRLLIMNITLAGEACLSVVLGIIIWCLKAILPNDDFHA